MTPEQIDKLGPAPFAVSPRPHDTWGVIRDANGMPIGSTDTMHLLGDVDAFRAAHEFGSPEHVRGPELVRIHAEFFALARNAFEVMKRRGWSATKWMPHDDKHGQWVALTEWDDVVVEGKTWPDPFTALVEADRWYTENVEAKHGQVS